MSDQLLIEGVHSTKKDPTEDLLYWIKLLYDEIRRMTSFQRETYNETVSQNRNKQQGKGRRGTKTASERENERESRNKFYTESQLRTLKFQEDALSKLNELNRNNKDLVDSLKKDTDALKKFYEYSQGTAAKTRENQISAEYGEERRKFADKNLGSSLIDHYLKQNPILQVLSKRYVDTPGSESERRKHGRQTLENITKQKMNLENRGNIIGANFGEEARIDFLNTQNIESKMKIQHAADRSRFMTENLKNERGDREEFRGRGYGGGVRGGGFEEESPIYGASPIEQRLLPSPDNIGNVTPKESQLLLPAPTESGHTPFEPVPIMPEKGGKIGSLISSFLGDGQQKDDYMAPGPDDPSRGEVSKLPKAYSTGFLWLGNMFEDFLNEWRGYQEDEEWNAIGRSKKTGGGVAGAVDAIGDIGGMIAKIGPALGAFLTSPIGLGIIVGILGAAAIIALIRQISKPWTQEQMDDEVRQNLKRKRDAGEGVDAKFIEDQAKTFNKTTEQVLAIAKEEKIVVSGLTSSGTVSTGIGAAALRELEGKQDKETKELSSTDAWKTPGLYWWMEEDPKKRGKFNYFFSKEASKGGVKSSKDLSDDDKILLLNNRLEREGAPKLSRPDQRAEALDIFQRATGTGILQQFHSGGVVPGPIGSEQTVGALGGEEFFSPNEATTVSKSIQELLQRLREPTESSTFNTSSMEKALNDIVELNKSLLEEMKKNTDITDKKELKVNTPSSPAMPTRDYVHST